MTDQAPELLPCPFCGDDKIMIKPRSCTGVPSYYQAECDECGATSHGSFHLDKIGAAKEWNARPTPAERPSVLDKISAQLAMPRPRERPDPQVREALEAVRQELWVDYCLRMGRTDTDPAPFNAKPVIRIIDTALTASPSDAAKPDFETAAHALGFQQMPSGKWWAPNPLWHVTYMEHWDSAEAVFSWLWENRAASPSDAAD